MYIAPKRKVVFKGAWQKQNKLLSIRNIEKMSLEGGDGAGIPDCSCFHFRSAQVEEARSANDVF